MSEEEKKAIKQVSLLLAGDISLHIIDDDGGTAYAGTVNKLYNDDLQTVLNLIEKQNKRIEKLEKEAMENELKVIGAEEYTKASMGEIIENYYTANEDCVPKYYIQEVIKGLERDIENITKKIRSRRYLDDYSRNRWKAYRLKTKEIKKRLEKLLEGKTI